MRYRLPWIVALIFLVYGFVPIVIDKLLGFDLIDESTWAGQTVLILYYPWFWFIFSAGAMFRRYGLPIEGDWFATPTMIGMIGLVILVAAIAYGTVWALIKIIYRNR